MIKIGLLLALLVIKIVALRSRRRHRQPPGPVHDMCPLCFNGGVWRGERCVCIYGKRFVIGRGTGD